MKNLLLTGLLLLFLPLIGSAQVFHSDTARKAQELMSRQDMKGAIAVLTEAIEKKKDLNEAYEMRSNLYGMTGNISGILADLTALIELQPTRGELYSRRANFRTFRQDWDGALKDIDAAIANGYKTDRAFAQRALIKRQTGDMEGALADYQQAADIAPDSAASYVGYSQLLKQVRGIDKAIEILQTFIQRYEASGAKTPKRQEEVTDAVNVKAKRPGADGSQGYLTAVTTQGIEGPASPAEMERFVAQREQSMNLALVYVTLGSFLSEKQDLDAAEASVNKGVAINPTDPLAYQIMAKVKIKRGDLKGAIEFLTKATTQVMHIPDVHLDRGVLLVLQGKDAEAEAEFAMHLEKFPTAKEYVDKRRTEAKVLREQK